MELEMTEKKTNQAENNFTAFNHYLNDSSVYINLENFFFILFKMHC